MKFFLWSGPVSNIISNSGASHFLLQQSSTNADTGCLPKEVKLELLELR